MFGTSGSVGAQSQPSTYGSEYPTQQQYGAGQSSASGFGAPPAASSPSYGGGQQFSAPGAYGVPQAQPAYQAPQAPPSYGAQPGYGAPQQSGYPGQQGPGQGYGSGYPSAPPKKSKTVLWVAVGAAVIVAAVVFVLVRFVLVTEILDPAKVQEDVAAQFEDQEGVSIELNCPSDMVVEVGRTYECTGTTADSEDVTLVIEISAENGDYTWQEKQ